MLPLSVICTADNTYAMPLAVVLYSVMANLKSKERVAFFVIDGGISKQNKHKIQKSLDIEKCQINWINVPRNKFKNLKIDSGISVSAYHRLLVDELLPSELHKVIYLDSDLVVIGDLGELWAKEIGDQYLLAVQDAGIGYVSGKTGLMNYRELGIDPDCKYFNSGVMVINLKKWRADSIGQKVLAYIQQNHQYIRLHDQDGLNAILAGHWGELDPRWNRTPQIFYYASWQDSPFLEADYKNMIDNPYIIHFATTGRKPWNQLQYPDGDVFYKYLDMTDWAGWRYNRWRALQHQAFLVWRKFKRKVLAKGLS
jgi:lipopolysaccharide biosynthesis glycosyltransferase